MMSRVSGKLQKPSRLANAWQEEWYARIPSNYEGRSIQAAADKAHFRSVKQSSFTDAVGRKEHLMEDHLAVASAWNESAEEGPRRPAVRATWEKQGNSRATMSAEGGCGRGRACVLKDSKRQSRAELQQNARRGSKGVPWSRVDRTRRPGAHYHAAVDSRGPCSHIIDAEEALEEEGIAAAWSAAAGKSSGKQLPPGSGWRFIADPLEGKGASGKGSASAQSVKDHSLGRGVICHVSDQTKSDVGPLSTTAH
jgi:hypothetical protein